MAGCQSSRLKCSAPSATPSQDCSKIACNRALPVTCALTIKTALSCCFTSVPETSHKVFFRTSKRTVFVLHLTNTLIHLNPLNSCPKTSFPLNYFQPSPNITEKTAVAGSYVLTEPSHCHCFPGLIF